jgi:carbonic anhydrase
MVCDLLYTFALQRSQDIFTDFFGKSKLRLIMKLIIRMAQAEMFFIRNVGTRSAHPEIGINMVKSSVQRFEPELNRLPIDLPKCHAFKLRLCA